jgi:3-mercaptopyruvate sulfurtransferase SseA
MSGWEWILPVLLGLFLWMRFTSPSGVKTLAATTFQTAIREQPGLLVDVRQPEEFRQGHLREAKNVPLGQL